MIDRFFYTNCPDDIDLAGALELKRDDMVRAIVLQLHTATEDLLNIRTINRVLAGRGRRGTGNNAARALRKLFYGAGSVGFDAKLNLALAIGLIDLKTKQRFVELNSLRNRCSHNWRLNVSRRQGAFSVDFSRNLFVSSGFDLR